MFIYFNKNVYCPWLGRDIDKILALCAKYEKKIKGELEINVVSASEIKQINKRCRGINKPTDVLSFAWREDKKIKTDNLGQIYLCYEKITAQAKEHGAPVREEFVRILVHGVLHLVGYDHCEKKEAEKMFKLQEKIVDNYAY